METIQKEYLVKVCLQRLRGAKAEAAAIAAKRRSEFEALLEKTNGIDGDSHLGQLYKLASSAAAKANEDIARLAKELGTDLVFGPRLTISYGQWPEVLRHSEDRWQLAGRKIRRLEKEAVEQIERQSMDKSIRLLNEDLTPDEATAIIQAIPAAAELMPELKISDLKRERDMEAGITDDDVPF